MTRAAWVSEHAEQRAAERLGRWLTPEEWTLIGDQILGARALMLGRDQHGPIHYGVQLGGLMVRVLWDPRVAVVITVLPWRRNDGRSLRVVDTFHRHSPPRRGARNTNAWKRDMDL